MRVGGSTQHRLDICTNREDKLRRKESRGDSTIKKL